MRIFSTLWTKSRGWETPLKSISTATDLVLVFGATEHMKNGILKEVKKNFPTAYVCGCSTAGEIVGDRVLDDSLSLTAVHFEQTRIRASVVTVVTPSDSFHAGQQLANSIPTEGLVHAF